jgi:hypothetical protein
MCLLRWCALGSLQLSSLRPFNHFSAGNTIAPQTRPGKQPTLKQYIATLESRLGGSTKGPRGSQGDEAVGTESCSKTSKNTAANNLRHLTRFLKNPGLFSHAFWLRAFFIDLECSLSTPHHHRHPIANLNVNSSSTYLFLFMA